MINKGAGRARNNSTPSEAVRVVNLFVKKAAEPFKGKAKVLNDIILTLKPYLNDYGYWAVFGAIFFEDFGIPVPGESILIAGSLLASQGVLHIFPLLLIAWIGAVAGDNIGYAIGRFGGRRLALRYGHYVFINRERLAHAETYFKRHGGITVAGARFFVALRQLNGIVAGVAEMSWWHFLLYNALGAALWVGFWGMLAYELGTRVSQFLEVFKKVEVILIGGFVLAGACLAIYLAVRRHK
jgi:membrane protein DedA with SNARE-associated domain